MIRRTVGRHELSTVEGQTLAVNDVLPMLETLHDPVRRSEYAHLLADLTGVTEGSVVQALDARRRGKPAAEVETPARRGSAQDKVEREMLKLLARDGDLYAAYAPRLQEEHFPHAGTRAAFVALREAGGDTSALAGGEDAKVAATVSQLAVEPLDGEPTPEYAEHVWARLEEFRLKTLSDALRLRLQKLNPTTDPDFDQLFGELAAVDGDLRRLRQGQRDPV